MGLNVLWKLFVLRKKFANIFQLFRVFYLAGCDNSYNGEVLPCLLRPDVPPFSYSTERAYNMEYKKWFVKSLRSCLFIPVIRTNKFTEYGIIFVVINDIYPLV